MSQPPSYSLWLPSWYPNKLDPFDGDFIQRHAQAVSACFPVHVFFLVKDEKKVVTDSVKVEERKEGNLTETIIYYHSKDFSFRPANRFFSFINYRKLARHYLANLFKRAGLPTVVHVHIAFKAGLMARWIRKKFGIPYLLTEQWTIYLDEAKPNFNDLPALDRALIDKVISGSSLLLPVSEYLGTALKKRWPSIPREVVPNVVNTSIFNPAPRKSGGPLRLVHISTLSYQKDPESLLQAAKALKDQGIHFMLDVFGPRQAAISAYIENNGLSDSVIMRGEVPQIQLAACIKECDALILYSRYETFGCVLIEANACGRPVIVPDTALMRELVNSRNGILAAPGSAEGLTKALLQFNETKNQFDPVEIAAMTKAKYSYERVGQLYAAIYSRFKTD